MVKSHPIHRGFHVSGGTPSHPFRTMGLSDFPLFYHPAIGVHFHPFNAPSCLEVFQISHAKLLAPFHRPSSAISEARMGRISDWAGNGTCRWDVYTSPWDRSDCSVMVISGGFTDGSNVKRNQKSKLTWTNSANPSNPVGPVFQSKIAFVIFEPWICDPHKATKISLSFKGILNMTNHLRRKWARLKRRHERA